MAWIPAAIAGGVSLVGGLLSNRSNRRSASRANQFQLWASNTAERRRVQDLMKAGLNPMLGLTQAASMPSASQSHAEGVGEKAASSVSSAMMAKQLKAEVAKTEAETLATQEHARTLREQGNLFYRQGMLSGAEFNALMTEMPRRINEMNAESSEFKKQVSPYLRDAAEIVGMGARVTSAGAAVSAAKRFSKLKLDRSTLFNRR